METGSALRLDMINDRIARLTFDQPGSKVNTLHSSMLAEFEQVLEAAQQPQVVGTLVEAVAADDEGRDAPSRRQPVIAIARAGTLDATRGRQR